MPHYKRMYDDKEFLYAFDLDGRDVTLQIERVQAGEVSGEQGRKSKKPIVKFTGKDKKLAVNKTNGKIIAKLYGTNTDDWINQWVTLYPTTTAFGGDTVECIRVRPNRPERQQGKAQQNGRGQQRQSPAAQQSDAPPDDDEARAIAAADKAAAE